MRVHYIGWSPQLWLLPILCGVILLQGCGGVSAKPGGNGKTPVTLKLLAAPEVITAGAASTLTFSSQNANSVSIDGVGTFGANGSIEVKPSQTTIYTATATGPGGTAQASATVTVNGAGIQPQVQISADPVNIASGGTSTLTWTSANADTVTIEPNIGSVAANGSMDVHPMETTTYTITGTNANGSLTDSVTISIGSVSDKPTAAIAANPATITSGQSSTLSWSTTNATTVTIDNGVGTVQPKGSATVQPTVTTTYTITATGPTGTATAATTVSVGNGNMSLSGWLTYKMDNGRTGANTGETALTPAKVNASGFGRKFQVTVDGLVFAQPLYVRNLAVTGKGARNVMFIATEHDSVYAFDADTGEQLWKRSLLPTGATTVPSDGAGRTALGPEVGITGTPVIDPTTGKLYVSAMTLESGSAFHRLHALDIASGAEAAGSPVKIEATVAGTGTDSVNGQITFKPLIQNQRAGLTLSNGIVYVAFGSFSDQGHYHGWLFGYNAGTLSLQGVWNASPDGEGTSIWQAGAAPAADADGNIYLMTADGHQFNVNIGGSNYGDSFVKLHWADGKLKPTDWFAPYNQDCLDEDDLDLGSGGPMLVPDLQNGLKLLVAGSKEGRIYVLNRDNMGHYQTGGNSQIVQDILINPKPCKRGDSTFDANSTYRMYSTPAYWNGTVYQGSAFSTLRAFQFQAGKIVQASQTTTVFAASGQSGRSPIPVVSANGNTGGIVWVANRKYDTGHATVYAYDATNLANELWNSDMNAARDGLGNATVFTVPTVIDGKVISTNKNTVNVFGLLQ